MADGGYWAPRGAVIRMWGGTSDTKKHLGTSWRHSGPLHNTPSCQLPSYFASSMDGAGVGMRCPRQATSEERAPMMAWTGHDISPFFGAPVALCGQKARLGYQWGGNTGACATNGRWNLGHLRVGVPLTASKRPWPWPWPFPCLSCDKELGLSTLLDEPWLVLAAHTTI